MDIWKKMYNKAKTEYHKEQISPFIVAHHVVAAVEDEDGNIFVCQENNHVIRKIAYDEKMEKRYVTTILGTAGVKGDDDGSPDIALFANPQDISYDGNGGFWIAQRENPALRKYSVE